MAIDGTYDVELSMPGGKRPLKITLKPGGASLSGSIDGPFGDYSFSEGTAVGDDVAWSVRLQPQPDRPVELPVERPGGGFFRRIAGFIMDSLMGPPIGAPPGSAGTGPITELIVEFKATVTGSEIKGQMKFGSYATGSFKGIRSQD